MTEENRQILQIITIYLEKNPGIRFTQMLCNLNINTFADKVDPSKKGFLLRDPYYDSDKDVLERVLKTSSRQNEQI
jgi:hypothetical protein